MDTKEEKLINELEKFLDETQEENISKEHLTKLLKEYKKLNRRLGKILKMNDRFEMAISLFNDSLLSDKKERGKKVLESKKRVLQNHQEQTDRLNAVIKQREDEIENYKRLLNENEKLKSSNENLTQKIKKENESKKVFAKEDIDKILKENFSSDEEILIGIKKVLDELFKSAMNFNEMSVENFEDNHLYTIQTGIYRWLNKKITETSTALTAVTNSLIREHFQIIHKMIAKHLLEGVKEKNRNYEKYLRGYSGDVFIAPDKNRYKKQEIIDINGDKWNITSIVNLMSQFANDESKYVDRKTIYEKYQNELSELAKKETSHKRDEESLSARIIELKTNVASLDSEISNKRRSLQNLRNEFKEDSNNSGLSNTITALEVEIRALVEQEGEESGKLKVCERDLHSTEVELIELTKREEFVETELDKVQKSKDALKVTFERTYEKYSVLLNALSAVLMKKKSRV